MVAAPALTPAADLAFYRLEAPGGDHAISQASGLHFGRLGRRDGLWVVCDRNGGPSAGRLYYLSKSTLARAEHRGRIRADEAFTIVLPSETWSNFVAAYRDAGDDLLRGIRERIEAGHTSPDVRPLDLEAITVGPSTHDANLPAVFVVAEEPLSAVLELAIDDRATPPVARLRGVFAYREADDESGWDHNDGVEGLAYAGKGGWLFWAEEGTRSHTSEARPRLMFRDPRLGRAELKAGRMDVDAAASEAMTSLIHGARRGAMQTLNALAMAPHGALLAVDRNGGWVLRIDADRSNVEHWLNLYDLDGVNLREALADFPGPRRMPYISIEGIAVDSDETLWMVDDPAAPEAFRESCLIRVRGAGRPAAP